ncbi:uncharacterized protein BDR25DRAFT_311750 [Lindgomyces ingoldianus]|uniref:Uncharacterized protein n=1 Tax=Lindgomyces ingoldianus TaxID=673940 RepID=A0ACB6R5U3_9PLEO|nr:uncharacterized protein BDR25DRAFT_311750 [Lindgomyces ingoldianus]KAF2474437.1 hypothetical protein BDR25DRAFT_311750 [Lindgomyces ingoldianus]
MSSYTYFPGSVAAPTFLGSGLLLGLLLHTFALLALLLTSNAMKAEPAPVSLLPAAPAFTETDFLQMLGVTSVKRHLNALFGLQGQIQHAILSALSPFEDALDAAMAVASTIRDHTTALHDLRKSVEAARAEAAAAKAATAQLQANFSSHQAASQRTIDQLITRVDELSARLSGTFSPPAASSSPLPPPPSDLDSELSNREYPDHNLPDDLANQLYDLVAGVSDDSDSEFSQSNEPDAESDAESDSGGEREKGDTKAGHRVDSRSPSEGEGDDAEAGPHVLPRPSSPLQSAFPLRDGPTMPPPVGRKIAKPKSRKKG